MFITGKGGGNGNQAAPIKSLQWNGAALTTKFDKFNIPDDDDDDESSDEEEANRKGSTSALNHHNDKGKKKSLYFTVSAFTMRLVQGV
jgi:hypothetical protein